MKICQLNLGTIIKKNELEVDDENEKLKINAEYNENQPHVVKVYRKNRGNSSENQKKS